MPGKPLKIIENTPNSFQLHEEILRQVLCNESVKDKKVCVVSVTGAFRKGKSFLLTLLIRCLSQKCPLEKTQNNEELPGFVWKKGVARQTTGIWAWDELFTVQAKDGEEILVLLLDTQGTFDTLTTMKDSGKLFGMSALLSSVLIFNVSQTVQEDDLQHLSIFADYGSLAYGKTNRKPFQNLLFLVRDWLHDSDYEFGENGGKIYLDEIFSTSRRASEMLEVRQKIDECFQNKQCFLLPHPGMPVLEKQEEDLVMTDISEKFKNYVWKLNEMLFSPHHIQKKTEEGEPITCKMLFTCFQSYVNLFQNEELPEPQTILRATTELYIFKLLQDARQHLKAGFKQHYGSEDGYILPDDIEMLAETLEQQTVDVFLPKSAGKMTEEKCKREIAKLSKEEKETIIIRNESKCPFWLDAISSFSLAFTKRKRINTNGRRVSISQRRREIKALIIRRLPSFLNPSKRLKQIIFWHESQDKPEDTKTPGVTSNTAVEPILPSSEIHQVLLFIALIMMVSVFIVYVTPATPGVIVAAFCLTIAIASYFDLI